MASSGLYQATLRGTPNCTLKNIGRGVSLLLASDSHPRLFHRARVRIGRQDRRCQAAAVRFVIDFSSCVSVHFLTDTRYARRSRMSSAVWINASGMGERSSILLMTISARFTVL